MEAKGYEHRIQDLTVSIEAKEDRSRESLSSVRGFNEGKEGQKGLPTRDWRDGSKPPVGPAIG